MLGLNSCACVLESEREAERRGNGSTVSIGSMRIIRERFVLANGSSFGSRKERINCFPYKVGVQLDQRGGQG